MRLKWLKRSQEFVIEEGYDQVYYFQTEIVVRQWLEKHGYPITEEIKGEFNIAKMQRS